MAMIESERSWVVVALDGSPAAATALPLARRLATQLHAGMEALYAVEAPATDFAQVATRVRADLQPDEPLQIRWHAADPASAILDMASDRRVALLVLATHGHQIDSSRSLGAVPHAVVARATRPILLVRPERAGCDAKPVAPGRSILIPFDGTPATSAALGPALDLAIQVDASIDLLYVVPTGPTLPAEPGSVGPPVYVDQPHHEWPAWRHRVLHQLSWYLGDLTVRPPMRVRLVAGHVADQIVRFADEHESQLIVLVRRSQLEPGQGLVLRSVVGGAPCPVLVIGARPIAGGGPAPGKQKCDVRSLLLGAEDNLVRTLALAHSSEVLQDELQQLVERVRRLRTTADEGHRPNRRIEEVP
jgi:nucleotide-binding universal stress UspA family protein